MAHISSWTQIFDVTSRSMDTEQRPFFRLCPLQQQPLERVVMAYGADLAVFLNLWNGYVGLSHSCSPILVVVLSLNTYIAMCNVYLHAWMHKKKQMLHSGKNF